MTSALSRVVVAEIKQRGDLGGDETYALLRRSFAAAAEGVPSGLVTDDGRPEELGDSFSMFLVAKLARLGSELATKTSDAAIAAYVEKTAHHWLVDRVRTCTDHGSHRHTLEQLMRKDRRFAQHPLVSTLWGLVGASSGYTGQRELLHEAAAAVTDVRPGRPASADRRASLAPLEDLATLLLAVLAGAAGWVDVATLTVVVERRVGYVSDRFASLQEAADQVELDVDAAVWVVDDAPLDMAAALRVAETIWQEMDDDERRIVLIRDNIPAIEAELGIKRSQANVQRARVRQHLEGVRQPDASPEFVFAILERSAEEMRDRTKSRLVRPETTEDVSTVAISHLEDGQEGARDV